MCTVVSPVCWRRGEWIGRSLGARRATRSMTRRCAASEQSTRAVSRGTRARARPSRSRFSSSQSRSLLAPPTCQTGLSTFSEAAAVGSPSSPATDHSAPRLLDRTRGCRPDTMATRPVTVSWRALTETPDRLGDELQEAFGPTALGLLIVSDLPAEYAQLRERVRLHDVRARSYDRLSPSSANSRCCPRTCASVTPMRHHAISVDGASRRLTPR